MIEQSCNYGTAEMYTFSSNGKARKLIIVNFWGKKVAFIFSENGKGNETIYLCAKTAQNE